MVSVIVIYITGPRTPRGRFGQQMDCTDTPCRIDSPISMRMMVHRHLSRRLSPSAKRNSISYALPVELRELVTASKEAMYSCQRAKTNWI
jgi:hypothetical protein